MYCLLIVGGIESLVAYYLGGWEDSIVYCTYHCARNCSISFFQQHPQRLETFHQDTLCM